MTAASAPAPATGPGPALRYTGPESATAAAWSPLAYHRALVRAQKRIRGASLLIAHQLLDHADTKGKAWPSQTALAEAAAVHPRTVRQAVTDLEAAGLLERRKDRGRTIYHLTEPPAETAELTTDRRTRATGAHAPPAHTRQPTGAHAPIDRRTRASRKMPYEDAQGRCGRSGGGSRSLWDKKPEPDARAIDLLVRGARLTRREAAGLVSAHRPTAQEVIAVLANAAAWAQADRRGETAGARLRNRRLFVRSSIQQGNTNLDDRVASIRARARRRAHKAQESRSRARKDSEAQEAARTAKAAETKREAAASTLLDSLDDTTWSRVCTRAAEIASHPIAAQCLHAAAKSPDGRQDRFARAHLILALPRVAQDLGLPPPDVCDREPGDTQSGCRSP